MKHGKLAAIATFATCSILGTGLIQGAYAADATPKTETRHVQVFKDLEIDCSADAQFTVAPIPSVTITAPADLLPLLVTRIEGDKLVIRLKDGTTGFHLFGTNDHVTIAIKGPALRSILIAGSADVTAPTLTGDRVALTVQGSGSIHASGVSTGKLEVSIPGSGDVKIESVDAKTVSAEVDGSGTIELSGHADRLDSGIAGSGEIRAGDLKVRTLVSKVAGSGDMRAYATQSASVVSTGSGHIVVAGNPAQRQSHVDGSGDVDFK